MMTKADVQKKLDLIQEKYNKIKAMVAQGKSLDEIKTSLGEPTTRRRQTGRAAVSEFDRSDLQGSVEEELNGAGFSRSPGVLFDVGARTFSLSEGLIM